VIAPEPEPGLGKRKEVPHLTDAFNVGSARLRIVTRMRRSPQRKLAI
jgi:hypothetical protein